MRGTGLRSTGASADAEPGLGLGGELHRREVGLLGRRTPCRRGRLRRRRFDGWQPDPQLTTRRRRRIRAGTWPTPSVAISQRRIARGRRGRLSVRPTVIHGHVPIARYPESSSSGNRVGAGPGRTSEDAKSLASGAGARGFRRDDDDSKGRCRSLGEFDQVPDAIASASRAATAHSRSQNGIAPVDASGWQIRRAPTVIPDSGRPIPAVCEHGDRRRSPCLADPVSRGDLGAGGPGPGRSRRSRPPPRDGRPPRPARRERGRGDPDVPRSTPATDATVRRRRLRDRPAGHAPARRQPARRDDRAGAGGQLDQPPGRALRRGHQQPRPRHPAEQQRRLARGRRGRAAVPDHAQPDALGRLPADHPDPPDTFGSTGDGGPPDRPLLPSGQGLLPHLLPPADRAGAPDHAPLRASPGPR